MKRRLLALASCILLGCATAPAAPHDQTPADQHPYVSLASRVGTRLRFVTDISFPQGPAWQVKVYDWIVGPKQEIADFPLEGFAAIEVKAGEIDTTIGGVTSRRHAGEHFVVPEKTRLDISVPFDTGRGDNLVSLHGVVAIRR